ncbi:hypothetical protein GCM10022254_20750 [Actinomadura meridiana]|uniref:Stress-response A/B barrel domain-containing protein n=1 Tax=Actinomadura meridiana TaxID=559626 RepID=A0ABP8BX17_9ACTN
MSGFRHVVLIKWAEGTTTGQQDELAARLGELPAVIPEIRGYSLGADVGLSPAAHDFAIIADFADQDAYLVYRDHPSHREVVDRYLTPITAERTVVQYEP